jgi:hypothetical protein
LEPAICDIELVKLTKEYPNHPVLYYNLIPCSSGETLHTNSDIMFNLYAYAGNYVKLYDESLNYLGCYGVSVVDQDPNINYEKFWLGTAYTSNLVGAYSDCGCTGRTELDIVQEEPGVDRLFWYSALDCATSATTYTFKSSNADLLTGTTSYKIYNTGTTESVCIFNPKPTFVQATSWLQILSAYTDCQECEFIPPSPTPSNTPTNTPTPSITPTPNPTSVTATPTPTPTETPPVGNKSLEIYVRDAATTQQTVTLYYTVNYGPSSNIPGATSVILPISCSQIYTITGLSLGDVVIINTSINCVIEGTQGFISCPSITSFNLNYIYVMDTTSTQAISLTVDTSIIP